MNFFSILIISFSLLAAFAAAYILRSMFIPTRGKKITKYENPTKALMVLDIQESGAAMDKPLPIHTPLGKMITVVNRLIDFFNLSGFEVVYVKQVFRHSWITRLHGGRIVPGHLEPRLSRWLKIVNNNSFTKNRTDAFSNKELENFLIKRETDQLYLVGLDAAFCVYFTARGAINRGYSVTVVSDGVMSGKEMGKVLERFRRIGIKVISSDQLISSLKCAGKESE